MLWEDMLKWKFKATSEQTSTKIVKIFGKLKIQSQYCYTEIVTWAFDVVTLCDYMCIELID